MLGFAGRRRNATDGSVIMAEPTPRCATNGPKTQLLATSEAPRIPLVVFGLSLGLFLSITYVLCVGFDLLLPGQAMYQAWLRLFPGFTWLTWSSFLLGLVESFAYGWYVALIFCPLFNFFAARFKS
jgi:hypothetical protein